MLDLFFRKYAWTANLLLLFLGAWFTARMVNTLVGALIRPRPQAELSAAGAPPPRFIQPVDVQDPKLYHLIGVEPPAEPVTEQRPPSRPQNCDDPLAAPVKSELRLSLVASVLAQVPRFSLATVVDGATHETRVVGVGEQIGSARFLALERVRSTGDITGNAFRLVAIVCNDGTKEYVEADSSISAEGPTLAGNIGTAPVPPPGGPTAMGGGMAGVRTVAPNRYQIDRNVIDSTLSDMSKIAMDARIVPSFKNGVSNGFKLFSIRPGSLYSAIGIENGDVIQRINGYEINSPEKALELYSKLRESSHVKLDLEHNGQPLSKEYDITGP
jgi:general secretion pathway protein C